MDQLLECKVENTTKAGLKASIQGDDNPLIIFVPRDLHLENEHFSNINVDEKIVVKIIGVRFELNDKQVAVIAELTGDKK